MKRTIFSLAAVCVSLLFLVSCYYDNEEALYSQVNSACDTTNVTFSGTIVTLLSDNCYSCHANNTAANFGGNIHLENYSDVVTNSPQIAQSVKHTGSITPMPKNGGMIKSCSITQFDIWVRNGMVNN